MITRTPVQNMKRFPQILIVVLIAFVTFLSPQVSKAAPMPEDISQLKSLEAKLSKVVKKVLPATVCLFSARNGASGSGVIVSKDGLILTAGHVVRGTEAMTIIFPNGKQAQGKVLGANYTRDSAMIQILDSQPARGWPHVGLGQSKDLATGELLIALGHAGGYDPVRTPPIRFGRVIASAPDQFFTTDCALIGGDSGGPLFDLQGRLIGIHSSIGTSLASNNHAGIEGFLQDWEKMKKGETWGRLGGSSPLDNPDAPVLGIISGESTYGGIAIRHVFEGGPASKAGLRARDIIRSINGKPITNLRSLHLAIAKYQPGDTIQIRIIRGKGILMRSLKLGRRADILPDNKR